MDEQSHPTRTFHTSAKLNKILMAIVGISLLAGVGTGYVFAAKNKGADSLTTSGITTANVKSPEQDKRTFRDFAEGKVTVKPQPKNGGYSEGTHLLVRDSGVPVALTSSVVDLSQYENKRVKVFGETQKAVKEGWLMDVGLVEEIK